MTAKVFGRSTSLIGNERTRQTESRPRRLAETVSKTATATANVTATATATATVKQFD